MRHRLKYVYDAAQAQRTIQEMIRKSEMRRQAEALRQNEGTPRREAEVSRQDPLYARSFL